MASNIYFMTAQAISHYNGDKNTNNRAIDYKSSSQQIQIYQII